MGVLAPRFPLLDYILLADAMPRSEGIRPLDVVLHDYGSIFSLGFFFSTQCLHPSPPSQLASSSPPPTSPRARRTPPRATACPPRSSAPSIAPPTPSPRANVTSASPVHPRLRAAHPLRCSQDTACVCKSPTYLTNVTQCAGGCSLNAATVHSFLAVKCPSGFVQTAAVQGAKNAVEGDGGAQPWCPLRASCSTRLWCNVRDQDVDVLCDGPGPC
ncbi:hypothetical protein B0H15DRAFT_185400 [Mycena belliarum]|uniref:Uncharacterized protein n=1 Tax=Mycena belliarum TaxID=1033014 RepID=A0AAD6XSF7_9AGAR|nr:hypothetical protein B0H15DRAFT_185400 [Mycena belliae]